MAKISLRQNKLKKFQIHTWFLCRHQNHRTKCAKTKRIYMVNIFKENFSTQVEVEIDVEDMNSN